MKYSILMSVYIKEKPVRLKSAIDSMLAQTVAPDQFVIVCDGPLTLELENVLNNYFNIPSIEIVRLPVNKGLPSALNFGLEKCHNEIIVRMDSDDISLDNRAQMLVSKIIGSNFDIVGSSVLEFSDNELFPENIKHVPLTKAKIEKYAKYRNPFNHPSVAFKKSAILSIGGYEDFHLYEDYHLWVKAITSNLSMCNIDTPLIKMRVDRDLYERRGGKVYFESTETFQKFLLDIGFISITRFKLNLFIRHTVQVKLENKLRGKFYKRILRKKYERK